jgi:integrase
MHSTVKEGMVWTTHLNHVRELKKLRNLEEGSAPISIIKSLTARARNWRASTTLYHAASTQAALRLLPLYAEVGEIGIRLQGDPHWEQAMRTWRKHVTREIPHQAAPIVKADIAKIARNPSIPPRIRAFIVLSWVTAQRTSTIRRVRQNEITINREAGTIRVLLTGSKTVLARGAYTILTKALPEWLDLVEANATAVGKVSNKGIRIALRTEHPEYECRSLRRGALQQLAAEGVPEPQLLEFSGHKSIASLRTYLGHGQKSTRMQQQMASDAAALI